MATEEINRLIEYQRLLREEKKTLLRIEVARAVLVYHIEHILQEGLFRSIKRDTLTAIQNSLREEPFKPEVKAIRQLLDLPFYEEVWNKARGAAMEGIDPALPDWNPLFRETARLRNFFLEEYAFLIPKMIRYYFHTVSPALSEDLESEGVLGLFRSLESFDVENKKGNLRVHIQTRILSTLIDFYKQTESAKARLAQKGQEEKMEEENESAGEEGESDKSSRTLVENLSEANREDKEGGGASLVSLEELVPHTEESHYADMIVGEDRNPFEIAEGRELVQRLLETLDDKSPVERFMIHAKWNLSEDGAAHAPLSDLETALAKLRFESARNLLRELNRLDLTDALGKRPE